MVTLYKCDICGGCCDTNDVLIDDICNEYKICINDLELDICPDCRKSLHKWMKERANHVSS